MDKPYSKIRKLYKILSILLSISFLFSFINTIVVMLLLKLIDDIMWINITTAIITFLITYIFLYIIINDKFVRLIDNEITKPKNYYILHTDCKSIEELLSKFNGIEKLNNSSYLYRFDSKYNLNTIVIYKLIDFSKRNIDLQRRYANKFMTIKYPIAQYKYKVCGIKYYHSLKIQMYIVKNINQDILYQLNINHYNNGTPGFICCCFNLDSQDIIMSCIKHGYFKTYDKFINQLMKIFKVDYIDEGDF